MGKGNLIRLGAAAALIASSFIPGLNVAVATFLFSSGVGVAWGVASSALAFSDRQEAKRANPISNTSQLFVVYGEDRVGVSIVDMRSWVDGDNEYLYLVGAICVASENGSGIEDVLKVYFEDRLAIDNPVVDGTFVDTGVESEFNNHLKYAIHLGTHAQAVDAEMNSKFPSAWPSTSKGAGIAYIVVRVKYNEDVYPSGLPAISCVVRGNKLYDPRSSATAWSDNPALAIRDYLAATKYGCAVPDVEINDDSCEDAANYCEEEIDTVAYDGPRFTCNGVVDTSSARTQTLNELLSSCRGEIVHLAGAFNLTIRRPTVASSFALTEDNIVGEWEFSRTGADAPNVITARYVDPETDQIDEVTWPKADQANGFLAADNDILSQQTIDLPFTKNRYIAEQLTMTTLREQREDITIAVTSIEAALILKGGMVVPVTHSTPGFEAKPFWVSTMGILPDAKVRLILREYSEDAYTLDTQDTTATVPGTDLPDPYTCQPPSGLVVTSDASTALETQDGQYLPRIALGWTRSPDPFLKHYEVRFKPAALDWIQVANPAKDAITALIWPVTDGVSHDVEIRAVNTLGVKSAWVSGSVTVSTQPGPESFRLALNNWRPIRTDTQVLFKWEPGELVEEVWINQTTVDDTDADHWPGADTMPDEVLIVGEDLNEYSVDIPEPGTAVLLQAVPRAADLSAGPVRRDVIHPTPLSPASLEHGTTFGETTTIGTHSVIVRDPGGVATALYYRTRSGTSAPGVWTLKTASPADGTEYVETLALVEGHPSSVIDWRLDYEIDGETFSIPLSSPPMDAGAIPDIKVIPTVSATLEASASIQGDSDNASAKIAASTSAFPDETTVRAATAIDGRNITPAMIGTLLTAAPGDTVYYSAFGYSQAAGAGLESSALVTAQITVPASAVGGTVKWLEFRCAKTSNGTACADPATIDVTWNITAPAGYKIDLYPVYDGVISSPVLTDETGLNQTWEHDLGMFETGVELDIDYLTREVGYKLVLKNTAGVEIDHRYTPNLINFVNQDECP